jgi:hypothetical protein
MTNGKQRVREILEDLILKCEANRDSPTNTWEEYIHNEVKPQALDSIEEVYSERETELLDSLYWMYTQYCSKGHLFMGAGETASEILEDEGYIVVDSAGEIIKDNGDSNEQKTKQLGRWESK